MGAAFIIASPDTWKRVFVVVHYRARNSILLLICAGLLPFALITPVLLASSPIAVDRIAGLAFISDQLKGLDTLGMVIILLGLVAGFLSAFDSALLAAVHLSVLGRFYPPTKPSDTLDTFRQQIGLLFLLLNVLLIALPAIGMRNPYFFANLLLGHYAVIAGLLCGTLGYRRPLSAHQLVSLAIWGIASWYLYMLTRSGLTIRPSAAHLTSIPVGVVLFLLIGVAAYYCQRRRQYAAL
jgi:F0F1-type ATP synthase assembly protein I